MKGASEIRNLQLLAGPKLLGQDADRVYTVKATVRTGRGTEEQNIKVSYSDMTVIGNGSFGVVYKARLVDSGEYIAIKKVQQDMRFKNRELPIMKRLLHPNIVEMKFFFYTSSGEDDNKDSKKKPDLYLNLALEYLPDTLYNVCKVHAKSKQCIPLSSVALYSYQLFRSLAYLHSLGICHRDIKPQNLLLNRENGVLKLCDFGSAKRLVSGEANVAYICSRYYRAPELIFGATFYSSQIDVWSSGCVIAEMLLGQPVFPGGGMVDQLVEIIKVLGTPSKDQIKEMNPNYSEYKFPQINPHPWSDVFKKRPRGGSSAGQDDGSLALAIDLVSKLLVYPPEERPRPLPALLHGFFDSLRHPDAKLPNGKPLPPLFNFTPEELAIDATLNDRLIPAHVRDAPTPMDVNSSGAAAKDFDGAKASGAHQSVKGTSSAPPPTIVA